MVDQGDGARGGNPRTTLNAPSRPPLLTTMVSSSSTPAPHINIMHKDEQLTHFRSVAFLQGITGNGLFLTEEGLGTLSPCLDGKLREVHVASRVQQCGFMK